MHVELIVTIQGMSTSPHVQPNSHSKMGGGEWLHLDELKGYLANVHNLYVNLGGNF